ncbi:MAG: type II toxin-antitoxin system RelE/ParE family toxin [Cyclobacteriaceae bacterium]|nr:type II toxin-antitoxin system RelE/ParE family toxin [Cyclobacteriaceae bacterium]
MAKRKIIWTETAALQRRLILEYWVNRNQSTRYAIKLLELSDKKTEAISENPLTFRKTNFRNLHVASMGHFSIYYRFTEVEVFIMAFWDNRQDPKKLVKLLLKSTLK